MLSVISIIPTSAVILFSTNQLSDVLISFYLLTQTIFVCIPKQYDTVTTFVIVIRTDKIPLPGFQLCGKMLSMVLISLYRLEQLKNCVTYKRCSATCSIQFCSTSAVTYSHETPLKLMELHRWK